MESWCLDGSSQRSPFSALTGFLVSGKGMFGTARAQSKEPSSPHSGADTMRPEAPA